MPKPLVVGNWKMHGSKNMIQALVPQLISKLNGLGIDIVLCPPSLYLNVLEVHLQGSNIKLGAQNVYYETKGAYTGEWSISMLEDFSCEYVILGHSERRHSFFESNEQIAKKFLAAAYSLVCPILCVGETHQNRVQGQTFATIDAQLDAVLAVAGIAAFKRAVIAYEPVWAIGTGLTAAPEQAQEVHAYIRQKLRLLSPSIAEDIQILYGGSVKPDNAASLFSMPDINGGLIGGASLDAQDFTNICISATEKVN